MDQPPAFRQPSTIDKIFNRLFGLFVGLGFGLGHNYLLVVQGRKTGRTYMTPVNILDFAGKRYLVAPRGEAQWVRNARVSATVALKKGSTRERFNVAEVTNSDKAAILQCYLERFRPTVQRYFPIPAGSDEASFARLAGRYPVFELTACPVR
jgi:deazaflavin-dependent oxidoreductase (nitroreductase family)